MENYSLSDYLIQGWIGLVRDSWTIKKKYWVLTIWSEDGVHLKIACQSIFDMKLMRYTCITHNLIWGGLEHVWDGADEILPLEELEFDQHPLHTRPAAAPEGVHILRLLHQRAGCGFLRCPIIPCKHHQPMLRTSIKLVKAWSSLIIVNSELVCSSFRWLYEPWLC